MSASDTGSDGRSARSVRTREAIVSAVVELILEGGDQPTAPQVAERAGVSLRSVYGHFASVDELHRAAAEMVATMVVDRLRPIDPSDPVGVKIAELTSQRGRINEDLGPLLQAAARREDSAPALAESRRRGRSASRAQLARIFAQELAAFDPAVRRRREAAIDVLLDVESWLQLRHRDGLTLTAARRVLAEGISALLTPPQTP